MLEELDKPCPRCGVKMGRHAYVDNPAGRCARLVLEDTLRGRIAELEAALENIAGEYEMSDEYDWETIAESMRVLALQALGCHDESEATDG